MTKTRALSIFAVSLLIAQVPNLAPWYVNVFFPHSHPHIYRFDRFFESHIGDTWRYHVPSSVTASHLTDTLALGILRPSVNVYCSKSSERFPEYQNVNLPNSPITIDLAQFRNCRTGLTIDILANSAIGPQSSGSVVLGDPEYVKAVNDLVSLFSDRIRIILTIVVLLSLFVGTRNKLLGVASPRETDFNPNLVSWSLFLGVSSGIIPALVPLDAGSSIQLKLLYFISATCHLAPVITYLFSKYSSRIPRSMPLLVIASLIAVVPESGNFYSILGFTLAAAALTLSLTRRDTSELLTLYFVTLLLNFGKIGLIPSAITSYLPHWHFSSIYIAVYLVNQILEDTNKNRMVFKSLRFLHTEMRSTNSPGNFGTRLRELCDAIGCVRASLLYINHDSSCTIYTYDTKLPDTKLRIIRAPTLPPVFAHAITTRNTLLHVGERDSLAARLRAKSEKPALGFDKFSIIPLIGSTGELGALACTGYKIDLSDEHSSIAFESTMKIFSGYFTRTLESHANAERLSAAKDVEQAISALQAIQTTSDYSEMRRALLRFGEALGFNGFLGLVMSDTGQVEIPFGFGLTETQTSLLRTLNLRADTSNEHGPIPLAINYGRSTFVNDVSLMKELLSVKSVEFLETTNAASIAVIPFDCQLEKGNVKRGILYLNSESLRAFDKYTQGAVTNFAEALKGRLDYLVTLEERAVAESRLRSLVPAVVHEKLIRGECTRIDERGFLICIDLVGSTKLSKLIGTETYKRFVRTIQSALEKSAPTAGLDLLLVIWDAFYLGGPNLNHEGLKAITQLHSDLPQLATSAGIDPTIASTLSMRVVATYGDISRDFEQSGSAQNWTIVGNAMAVVSKLEQTLKSYPPGFYLDKGAAERLADQESLNRVSETLHLLMLFNSESSKAAA